MKDPIQLWSDLVNRFAEQSRCKSRQVGAIIVKNDRLIAEGWNSAPRGSTTEECPRGRCQGKEQASGSGLDQAICCHAEVNAIGNCAKLGNSTEGATLYCNTYPCAECAKLVVAAGILEVRYLKAYPSPLTDLIFRNAEVQVSLLEEISWKQSGAI